MYLVIEKERERERERDRERQREREKGRGDRERVYYNGKLGLEHRSRTRCGQDADKAVNCGHLDQ